MRYRATYLYLAVILILQCSFAASPDKTVRSAAIPNEPPVDVLVLHDSLPGPLPPGEIVGNNVLDLLGHFGLKGTLKRLEEFKQDDLTRYRFFIMVSIDQRKVEYPRSLIAGIRSTNRPVFWIGNHLSDLTSDPQFQSRIGFRPEGSSGTPQDFKEVLYKGISLIKGDPHISLVRAFDTAKVQVMATARNPRGLTLPYILRSGDFWYCADSPFGYAEEGDRYLVFCDLLHDFFKIPHQEERKALVRLEDISVEEDPEILKKFADYLYDRKVPFQISLVPIYVNPEDKSEIYLSDRPEFVRAIRYMVSKGGSVVMHGVTHQYRGKSTDDYEFWDEYADKPIPMDSRAQVIKKLRLGLEECFKNGIYPLTWETPHYGASQLDYKAFAEFFNSAYDRGLSIDRAEAGHYFPYPTIDRFNRFIIPEELGYIPEENPDPDALIKNCERLKAVRDGVASFFFHTFLDRKYLETVISWIEKT
jgi:uncharacterized protein YdaL